MGLATLQIIWFVLVAVLVLGFAIMAGFDFGVGNLHLFANPGQERDNNFYTIGPFWDSNQVWLITGGGAIFAAFPMVYATAFSGFYLALCLVLLALIMRGAAIEFQHQLDSPGWRKMWDLGFGIGSILGSILFGVAVGNVLRGLPLDQTYNFAGSFFGLLNPYSIGVGLLAFVMFTMHGASFLIARREGKIVEKAKKWGHNTWKALIVLFVVCGIWSYLAVPRLFDNFFNMPLLFIIPLLSVIGILYYPSALKKGGWSPFIGSTLNIVGLLGIVAASLFPYLIPSRPIENSLTIYNSSSSELTLWVMLLIAVIGVPIVLAYMTYVFRKFKKEKTQVTDSSTEISG